MIFGDSDLTMLWIVLGIGAIAIIVFLLRKFIPGLVEEEEVKDEKQRAEEEVNRYIVTEEIKSEVKDEEK